MNYLLTDTTLTFFVGSKPYQVDRTVSTFDEIVAEINSPSPDAARLVELADLSRKVRQELETAMTETDRVDYLTKGVITVGRNGVSFNGEPLHNALADRMMDILHAGFKLAPWVRFAENLYMNPAAHARDELFLWLEKARLPITDDGCFLAYKRVRSDYTDVYTGKFDNSPGQLVTLPGGRGAVDTVRDHTCSFGLHFCSEDYLPAFGANDSGNRVVIVKINPADVVSIPSDYDNTKGRTWRYEVVDEIPADEVPAKVWAPVTVSNWQDAPEEEEGGYEEDEHPDVTVLQAILRFKDAGYTDRQCRLDKAAEILDGEVDSFNDLDQWELNALVAALDAETDEVEVDDEVLVALIKESYLDGFTIVPLRQMASKAGLDSTLAWKVFSKDELADWLARNK